MPRFRPQCSEQGYDILSEGLYALRLCSGAREAAGEDVVVYAAEIVGGGG